jgi:hypothetical protein
MHSKHAYTSPGCLSAPTPSPPPSVVAWAIAGGFRASSLSAWCYTHTPLVSITTDTTKAGLTYWIYHTTTANTATRPRKVHAIPRIATTWTRVPDGTAMSKNNSRLHLIIWGRHWLLIYFRSAGFLDQRAPQINPVTSLNFWVSMAYYSLKSDDYCDLRPVAMTS